MASRMDRYYDSNSKRRSIRNSELYKTIYENNEYSNIEAVADIEKTNEIDITRIKEMLKNREDYRKNKKYSQVINKPVETIQEQEPEIIKEDEKSYDIRDVLDKAKEEKKETDKYHSLSNFDYDALKSINLKENVDIKKEESDELHNLIDNITNTSALNKIGDNDLSLDLLSDLKDGNTSSFDKEKIEKIKDDSMDKSFFTSSYTFKENDFEDLININKEVKKNNKLIKILIGIIVIIILLVIGILAYKNFI